MYSDGVLYSSSQRQDRSGLLLSECNYNNYEQVEAGSPRIWLRFWHTLQSLLPLLKAEECSG